ncbi:unnamed protein product [Caenorhabditis angaria]|uniref:C-type lectin domain-containing protein n=1 Tax=Caenorhabditis angaria TaxID=860376 RepID=A0A9P1N651_9PELO|nr:unnamed protein product [Caenorhabditis angaria]
MRILFFLFLLFHSFRSDDLSDCASNVQKATGSLIGIINGKCIAVSRNTVAAKSATACKTVGINLTKLSIDDLQENEDIRILLEDNFITQAYIGLSTDGSGTWSWENSDTSDFRNWDTPPVIVSTTTSIPVRSTLPPSSQRRSTAVVIGIDASLFSTTSWTFAQIDFATSLADYISPRGPSEFAIFAYGCTQISPYIVQFPNFVSTYEDVLKMISNLNETILHDCVRENPLDFSTMFNYQQWTYFNRYNTSPRPFKSTYISMIYFSSSSDSNNINNAKKLYTMPDSSVITISVGNQATSISQLSLPAVTNWIRVTTSDEIRDLVPTIDNIIFGTGAESSSDSKVLATATDCAFMNSEDGKWYPNGNCTTKLRMLCEYILTPREPATTKTPTDSWSDPCYTESTNFKYYPTLANSKCYKVSSVQQNFATSTNLCLGNSETYKIEPILTSILNQQEDTQLNDLVKDSTDGMFWIGLRRDPDNSENWKFLNGDPVTYSNWRDGYPKTADGCDCVAYVSVDQKWINTDCNKKLFSICSFEFNATIYQ